MFLRTLSIVAATAVLLSGCSAAAVGADSSFRAGAAQVPALPDVPIDAALTPVSRSSPSAEARAAMDLCLRPGDLAAVAGMARLASARAVRNYMLTNGNEPELQAEVPVWVVQLRGAITYRRSAVFNPVCVVVEGVPIIFAPYGSADAPGWSPPPDFVSPRLALPPLAP